MPILARNKRATYDYEIGRKYEAGIILLGHEVKSIKTGHVSLKGSYVRLSPPKNGKQAELLLIGAYIPLYKKAGKIDSYNPEKSRQLLISKQEIRYLTGKKREKGLTLVPIKMYTKRNLIKLEFGIGYGKTKTDKRESIKKKELDRKTRTLTKLKNR